MTLAIGLLATLAVGCSSSSASRAGDTTMASIGAVTTPPPATADAAARLAQDKADITATIVEFNRLYDQAAIKPGSPPPALFELVADPELSGVKKRLQEKVLSHESGYLPSPSKAKTTILSISIRSDSADVEDCTINDVVVTDSVTGRVLDGNVYSIRYRDALRRDTSAPHGWVLTSTNQIDHHTGADGCA
jgi:hypothetical protein